MEIMKVLVYYSQFVNSSQTTVLLHTTLFLHNNHLMYYMVAKQEYKDGYKDMEEEMRITAQKKSST